MSLRFKKTPINMQKLLTSIEEAFKKSEVNLPISLKIKLAELILDLSLSKKRFGLFVIFGWQDKWRKFTDIPDSSQDIFARHRINILNIQKQKKRRYNVAATMNFDSAILWLNIKMKDIGFFKNCSEFFKPTSSERFSK